MLNDRPTGHSKPITNGVLIASLPSMSSQGANTSVTYSHNIIYTVAPTEQLNIYATSVSNVLSIYACS